MSYKLDAIVNEETSNNWGEFTVRKEYIVRKGKAKKGVFGYIIQTVEKTTTITVHTEEGPVEKTTSEEIAEFTSNQVLYATHSYSEVFPILNGVVCKEKGGVCYDDSFQNGALLSYKFYEDTGTWDSDDEPPTSGMIRMVGRNTFVPTSKEEAEAIFDAINSGETIEIGGFTWKTSAATPAYGLPYLEEVIDTPNPVIHTVYVSWEKDGATTLRSVLTFPEEGGARKRTHRRRRRRGTRRYSSL